MVYTVDLSGDLASNEIFLLVKEIVTQAQKKSKEGVKRSLLLLLQKIFENSTGDTEGTEAIRQQLAVALAKTATKAPITQPSAPEEEPEAPETQPEAPDTETDAT